MPTDEHEPVAGDPGPQRDRTTFTKDELADRASRSIVVVVAWGLTALGLGFVGNLVLARLLHPSDFGVFGIGSVVLLVMYGLSEAGLGPGLIRRPEPPTRSELQALTGFQVAVTSVAALLVALVALPFGRTGAVVAVMTAVMPIAVLQTPGRIVFARELAYQRLAVVEAASVLSFYAWSIGTVLLGFGVWGLASGAVVRGVAGTLAIWLISDLGVVRPRKGRWSMLRPVVWYGVRIQSTWLVTMLRDLGLYAITASVAGISNLGLWTLARRLIEVPLVLFDSLWRVTFPTMSHILARNDDPAPILERSGRVFAVLTSLALVGFIGVFPASITTLFGSEWEDVASILPWATIGLLVAGTLSVSTVGYLQAAGHPEDTLVAATLFGLVWIVTTACLLGPVGIEAVGIGWITGGVTEAVMLDRAVRRRCGALVLRSTAGILVVGVAGCVAASIISLQLPPGLLSGALAAIVGVAATLVGLAVFARDALAEAVRTARSMLTRALRGSNVTEVSSA